MIFVIARIDKKFKSKFNRINRQIAKLANKYFLMILLVSCAVLLSILNYTPGTWLSGWDTLHPEFNFALNIKRALFGVWREEQGLGSLTVHSHMADLPRIILLWIFSFLLPLEFLRYFYLFITLVIGPVGVYFFLQEIVLKKNNKPEKQLASFLGGLFYLLNLGTLQHFYVPFEMFPTLYAALPWIFLSSTKYLQSSDKRYLLLFSIITLLATPMAYAATLWYAFFISFIIYLYFFCKLKKQSHEVWPLAKKLVMAMLIINSFWLLPNIYTIASGSNTVIQSKINQVFSPQAFAHDKAYATIWNAIQFKGFLFDWQKFEDGTFKPLLFIWHKHLQNLFVSLIGAMLSAIWIGGIVYVGRSRKQKEEVWTLFPTFLFALVFLVHSHEPFNTTFEFLRNNVGFFREGLRFPWTKFSLIVMFCAAVFFAQGILYLFKKTNKRNLITTVVLFAMIIWMWPAFTGNLISPSLRIKIPREYFQLFDWFNRQDKNTRIALLPMPTYRGWTFYKWGFEGAGFIWFGLQQPILLRDFDRWNSANENFYWEANFAIDTSNKELFDRIMQKYNIDWLIFDKNMIYPTNPQSLAIPKLEQILRESNLFKLEVQFGQIQVFKKTYATPPVYAVASPPIIEPSYKWGELDSGFDNRTYISNSKFQVNEFIPFRSIFTRKIQENTEFTIDEGSTALIIKRPLPDYTKSFTLKLPREKKEILFVDKDNPANIRYGKVLVNRNDNMLEVLIPKPDNFLVKSITPLNSMMNTTECQKENTQYKKMQGIIRLEAKHSSCNIAISLPQLPHSLSYIIVIESRHEKGEGLLFWLENQTSKKADIEVYLPKNPRLQKQYFIQPPMQPDGLGYTLHFDNISHNMKKTVNLIGKIEIYPFPYQFLTGIRLASEKKSNPLSRPPFVEFKNSVPGLYIASIGDGSNYTLVLSQSYDAGWQAYELSGKQKAWQAYLAPIFGQRLNNHVLVNNWANGWQMEKGGRNIIIVYTPQYLQFVGFLGLAGWFIFLCLKKD